MTDPQHIIFKPALPIALKLFACTEPVQIIT
jgi:hypothetical protein